MPNITVPANGRAMPKPKVRPPSGVDLLAEACMLFAALRPEQRTEALIEMRRLSAEAAAKREARK